MKKRLVNSLSMVKGRSLRGGHRPDHRVALRATTVLHTVVTTLRAPLSFGIAHSHESSSLYEKTSTLVDGLRGSAHHEAKEFAREKSAPSFFDRKEDSWSSAYTRSPAKNRLYPTL